MRDLPRNTEDREGAEQNPHIEAEVTAAADYVKELRAEGWEFWDAAPDAAGENAIDTHLILSECGRRSAALRRMRRAFRNDP